jgi:accessory colonization factor AcfC
VNKKLCLTILIGVMVWWLFSFGNCPSAQDKPLRIYGPEGPFAPMKECAELFTRIYGVKAEVLTGPGTKWVAKAKEDADVVYEETEHYLTQFMMRHP